eukprot:10204907-Alexandrium_andersonii.AAC.1
MRCPRCRCQDGPFEPSRVEKQRRKLPKRVAGCESTSQKSIQSAWSPAMPATVTPKRVPTLCEPTVVEALIEMMVPFCSPVVPPEVQHSMDPDVEVPHLSLGKAQRPGPHTQHCYTQAPPESA